MPNEMNHILLVEDNPGDVRLLVETLREKSGFKFSLDHVERTELALEYLKHNRYDVLLLDLSLPDSDGIDTVQRICSTAPHIPIIVLTGTEDDLLAIEAVHAGAQDYLIKGQVTSVVLIRAMNYAIERKKMEERLHFLATHDLLTSLPNRVLLQDRMTQSIERSKRTLVNSTKKWKIAVVLLDLDNFKIINDTLGHPQGDKLLQAVSRRLSGAIRHADTVSRMGGDEFMLIFENVKDTEDIAILGEKIRTLFREPFKLAGHNYTVTASIGISLYPDDGQDFQSLMKTADIAMYQAKRNRDTFCFYEPWMG